MLSPLKRKQIKLVFHERHHIKSIKTVPNTVITERNKNKVIFSGEGVENMQYEIEFSITPYKTFKEKKIDPVSSVIKLKPSNYILFLKSNRDSTLNIYFNDLLLTENIKVEAKKTPNEPYFIDDSIKTFTLENIGENNGAFELQILNSKLENVKNLVYTIKSGDAKQLCFEFE